MSGPEVPPFAIDDGDAHRPAARALVAAGRRSMIFTTNKPTSAWGRVLHDDLAQAIVDRILERRRNMGGSGC